MRKAAKSPAIPAVSARKASLPEGRQCGQSQKAQAAGAQGIVSTRHLDWVLLAEWRKNTQVAGAYSPGQRPGKADQDGGDEVDWGGAWGIGRNQLQC